MDVVSIVFEILSSLTSALLPGYFEIGTFIARYFRDLVRCVSAVVTLSLKFLSHSLSLERMAVTDPVSVRSHSSVHLLPPDSLNSRASPGQFRLTSCIF